MSNASNHINSLVDTLDEQVLQAQVQILEQGKAIISQWLRCAHDQGDFEQAVDWLLGNGADRYFNGNRQLLAVQAIRDAVQEFDLGDAEQNDPYQAARVWFEVG